MRKKNDLKVVMVTAHALLEPLIFPPHSSPCPLYFCRVGLGMINEFIPSPALLASSFRRHISFHSTSCSFFDPKWIFKTVPAGKPARVALHRGQNQTEIVENV